MPPSRKLNPENIWREHRYLQKVRLCTNLKDYNWCLYGANCLFAHSFSDLRLPDEGPNARFEWADVWRKNKVHTWYGQDFSLENQGILNFYFDREIKMDPLKVPDWAIAYAIVYMDYKPQRKPEERYWGMPRHIDALKKLRGGRLPPGVPPVPCDYIVRKLRHAYEATQPMFQDAPTDATLPKEEVATLPKEEIPTIENSLPKEVPQEAQGSSSSSEFKSEQNIFCLLLGFYCQRDSGTLGHDKANMHRMANVLSHSLKGTYVIRSEVTC